MKTLGDHIQVKRVEKGWDLAQLALKIGVTKSLVIRWEADREVPNDCQMPLLKGILKLDSDQKPKEPNT